MPLQLAFASEPGARRKLSSITEGDESEDDYEELAILRARGKETPSIDRPRTATDTAVTRTSSSASRPRSAPISSSSELRKTKPESSAHTRRNQSSSSRSTGQPPSSRSRRNGSDDELHQLRLNLDRVIEAQRSLQKEQESEASANEERHGDILRRIEALQTMVVSSSESHGESNIDALICRLETSEEDLRAMSDILKTLAEELSLTKAVHTETLLNLKTSAESERKALTAQIQNEKANAANRAAALEREVQVLSSEMDAAKSARHEVALEKERLARERNTLEKAEALFEQRKMAAAEELEHADETVAMIRAAEARLKEETARLAELSEYLKNKDMEAQEKLDRAEELSAHLSEMDAVVKRDFASSETLQAELEASRMLLARERVALLKERSKDRSFNEGILFKKSNSIGSADPRFRRALASLKGDLNRR